MKMSWSAQRDKIHDLIKTISRRFCGNGADVDDFVKSVVKRYYERLNVPLECFLKLEEETRFMDYRKCSLNSHFEDKQ
ncbi:MAG TPA: hypothetical protein VKR58_11950 [Aquella sp.]|nr:hypothetical protein [Aquella sp.]